MTLPTLPAPRIAYDTDGSYGLVSRNVGVDRSPYFIAPGAMQRLNADQYGGMALNSSWWNIASDLTGMAPHFLSIVFATPMHIVAWYASTRSRFQASVGAVTTTWDVGLDIEFQISRDTTNGLDGTWTTMAFKSTEADNLEFATEMTCLLPDDTVPLTMRESNTTGFPQYKDGSVEDSGWQYLFGPAKRRVKGVRLYVPRRPSTAGGSYVWSLLHLHLYGYPDDTAVPDRLIVLDGVTEDPMGDLHFGNIDYQDTATSSIKIQNFSSTLTAENIEVSLQSGYPSGAISSLALSLDGSTWSSTVNIGDLAPGAISVEIQVRVDPADGVFGQKFARIQADPEAWT